MCTRIAVAGISSRRVHQSCGVSVVFFNLECPLRLEASASTTVIPVRSPSSLRQTSARSL
eukprot:1808415-Rhodomonas_salina.1